jgi:succinylarginine dihydrolase
MAAHEVNFDGIVGPTHNYAGLSWGNLASARHQHQVASPRRAALQGLEKMKFVHDLGIPQAVLPPLRRPHPGLLRQLGFEGSPAQLIESAWRADRRLVAACYSASSMWTANAATVSPSPDCADGKLHLTPANLVSGLHRAVEAADTTRVLRCLFPATSGFVVHDPLPAAHTLSDEGAANHTRLCREYGKPGVEMFVYGRSALDRSRPAPRVFPARQTLEASQAVCRLHRLDPDRVWLIQQSPRAIDAGVFHNDVIAVGNRNFLMFHEYAFVDGIAAVQAMRQNIERELGWQLWTCGIGDDELPLPDAVASYLFNSQLLSRADGGMTLLCPQECLDIPAAWQCTRRILEEENPVDQIEFLDLRQSMNNGGGPACLRLRVVMTGQEHQQMHQGVLFDDELYSLLKDWVNRNYREELAPDDLRDPKLIEEVDAAFSGLQSILDLPGHVFRF